MSRLPNFGTRHCPIVWMGSLVAVVMFIAPVIGQQEPDPAQPQGTTTLPEGAPDPGENPFPPLDAGAIRAALAGSGAKPEALQRWDRLRLQQGVARATDSLLQERDAGYRAAVQAAAAGDPKAPLQLVKVLARSGPDRLLRSHCRYHLGRAFLDGGDPERALQVFGTHLQEDVGASGLDGEVLFFHGQAMAATPARKAAMRILAGYLKWFPDAPAGYRKVALESLVALLKRTGMPLHDVADAMENVERALQRGELGRPVQDQQGEITAQLEQMLQQAQEQEQQENSGSSTESAPGTPSEESMLPPGGSRIGNLAPSPTVAERWGDLQDTEREAIRVELGQKLPPHYRAMLEAYYLRLARRDG